MNHDEIFILASQAREQGQTTQAADYCREILRAEPLHAKALWLLGVLAFEAGNVAGAAEFFQLALQVRPDFPEASYNLGLALLKQGRLSECVTVCRACLAKKPACPDTLLNLGCAFLQQGRAEKACEILREALRLEPGHVLARSALLLGLSYHPQSSPQSLLAEHRLFETHCAAPLAGPRPAPKDLTPLRKLKIGFVSADLRRHPVGYFCLPFFSAHDPEQLGLTCYSDGPQDELSRELAACCETWRDTSGLSDARLAELIRADEIDILFDLAGHSLGNRLPVFARSPAPLQLSWAGYPGTTGLAAMDYLLCDELEIPAGSEAYYSERLLRLPGPYVPYAPPCDAPDVGPLPALGQGYLSFGCFNNLAKLSQPALIAWSEILHALPKAKLILITAALGDPGVAKSLTAKFARLGIEAKRLSLCGQLPHRELLAAYNRVDIALDPFPYCGGLSTLEALYMGVPVVSLAGETFAARHGVTHLSRAGLPDWLAESPERYLKLALAKAGDLENLAKLRQGLRAQLLASPLCDGPEFCRKLSQALRRIWLDYLKKEAED